MTPKQKVNHLAGKLLRIVNPSLVERIRDRNDLIRGKQLADDLDWQLCDAGIPRYASSGVQVGNRLFVFGGFTHGVLNTVQPIDLETGKWGKPRSMPGDMAESHQALVLDGKFIYSVSGQKGPLLSPSTPVCYSLNWETWEWQKLPDLPEGRYAGAGQIHNGRLHLVGGALEDRETVTGDHWSIAVEAGRALESEWKEDPAAPRAAVHRGNIRYGNNWYLFGGQLGESPPVPGDPTFAYVPKVQYAADFVLQYDFETSAWKELDPMPIAVSHTDYTTLLVDDTVYMVGGELSQEGYSAEEVPLTNEIWRYSLKSGKWSLAGHLPFRVKQMVCGYHGGKLFFATGQKDTSVEIPFAERFIGSVWSAPFPAA